MPRSKSPRLTWVLPTHNRAAWLAETVRSIQQQSSQDWNLIVLDDGSEDHTPEIMAALSQRDPRVQFVRFDDHKGAARCRNMGNQMAKTPYIHVTDAGDYYHRDAMKIAMRYMRFHPNVDVFYSGVAIMDERGRVLGEQKAMPYKAGDKINFSHPSVVYRKEVGISFQYPEVSIHTDCYEKFFLEVARTGRKFGFSKATLLVKRDLPGRDITEARKVRRKIYREAGWDWPFEEPDAEVQDARGVLGAS